MPNIDVISTLVFAAGGFVFVLMAIGLAGRIFRGRSLPTEGKSATYECGEVPIGAAWIRFNPRFLLLAVVFIIFDIEVAFLFPWAIVFRQYGIVAFFEMLFFVAVLLAGYLWFWKLGELRWVLSDRSDRDHLEHHL